MSASRETSWLRTITEGIAIVVSILLAFSIEAWWETQGEREREGIILSGLRLEFAEAETILEDLLKNHRQDEAAFEELHRLLRTGDGRNEPEKVIALSQKLWQIRPYAARMPVYQNLIASSGIDLIDSEEIRRALASYESAAVMNREWDEFLKDFDRNLMVGMLAPRLPYFAEIFDDGDSGGDLRPDIEALETDMVLRNLIAVRASGEGILAGRRVELLNAVREVRMAIN